MMKAPTDAGGAVRLRVISLGAGEKSTTMALMAAAEDEGGGRRRRR